MSSLAENENVDLPKFRLPPDFDPDQFELWTVRLPHQVDLSSLEGSHIEVNELITQSNNNYAIQWGDPVENESFRLLLAASESSDKSSDDDDADNNNSSQQFLYPCRYSFARHVQIGSILLDDDEEDEMETDGHHPQRRRAYASIPQKQGLKRRWMPLGSGNVSPPMSHAAAAGSRKRKHKRKVIEKEEQMDGSRAEVDEETRRNRLRKPEASEETRNTDRAIEASIEQQEKRERKRERKTAKKAAKKEKKKRKREKGR